MIDGHSRVQQEEGLCFTQGAHLYRKRCEGMKTPQEFGLRKRVASEFII